MKKLLLSAFTLAAIYSTTNAQILSEDFSAGIPTTWATNNGDGLTANPGLDNNYGTGAAAAWTTSAWLAFNNGVIASTSWYNPAAASDDWIATPGVLVTAESYVIWDSYAPDANFNDGYELRVSTVGQSPMTVANYSDLIYTNPGDGQTFTTRIQSLAAYAGQTIYIAFRNNSNDKYTLLMDNIIVQDLPPNSVALNSASVSSEYNTAATNVTISGEYFNSGSTAITALDVKWTDGVNTYTDNLTGLNVAPYTTSTFNHTTQLSLPSAGTYPVTVTVTLAGDADNSDDSANTVAYFLASVPAKIVVGEEKTGTWCGWCPRGSVGLANMESESDFIGIAVHNADPMTIASYDGSINTYVPGGYPGSGIDRVAAGDPNSANLLAMHNTRKTATVPAGINSITAEFNAATNMINVSTEAQFYGDIYGDFRLSCVIIEDDLTSTAAGWSFTNYYGAGGSGGPGGGNDNGGPMAFPTNVNGGYDFYGTASTALPANFGGYDHVARSLSNDDILGNTGSLPATLVNTGTYTYAFDAVPTTSLAGVSNSPFNADKAHAVVMVINAKTGEILNAEKASVMTVTSTEEISDVTIGLTVFPNPTTNNADVSFNLKNANNVKMEVYNAMGALVASENAGILAKGNHKMAFNGADLNAGFYFVNLTIGNQIITKKVTLTK
jgi:hypothetical protein